MAEMYLKVPSGAIVHLLPRVKVTFGSAQEYINWQSVVVANNTTKSGRSVAPPEIGAVHGVSWDGFIQACRHFGVSSAADTVA